MRADVAGEPVMTEDGERGSATVLMAGVMVLAGFLIAVSLQLASAIVARHRAGAIADLSALAAASGTTQPEGCEQARRVAAANGGRLLNCRMLADGSMTVDVGLGGGGLPGPARASARAGQTTSESVPEGRSP
jgi:secretion/DNA translocation related TadE-like protein